MNYDTRRWFNYFLLSRALSFGEGVIRFCGINQESSLLLGCAWTLDERNLDERFLKDFNNSVGLVT